MVTLRELRTAKNKQALLNALLMHLKQEDYDSIKISSLCRYAEVSQASFYNYFPKKSDLLIYFIQLWSLEVNWKVLHEQELTGLSAIEAIFEYSAGELMKYPGLMAELVAFQAKRVRPLNAPPLTEADKIVAHPNIPSIVDMPASGFESILLPQLQIAVDKGELPPGVPIASIALALRSVFFGIPMLIEQVPAEQISVIFQEQITIIWAGIKSLYWK